MLFLGYGHFAFSLLFCNDFLMCLLLSTLVLLQPRSWQSQCSDRKLPGSHDFPEWNPVAFSLWLYNIDKNFYGTSMLQQLASVFFSSPMLSNSFPGWQALEPLDLLFHCEGFAPAVSLANSYKSFNTFRESNRNFPCLKTPSPSHSSHIRLSQFFYALCSFIPWECILHRGTPYSVSCLLPLGCEPPEGRGSIWYHCMFSAKSTREHSESLREGCC